MTAAWRLGTISTPTGPQPVVAHDGGLSTLTAVLGRQAPGDVRTVVAQAPTWVPRLEQALTARPECDVADPPAWEPPLLPAKLICIGANYADHNAEMLGAVDAEFPYAFLKPPTTALLGSGRVAPLPSYAHEVDYEAELCVVIGERCRDVPRERALEVVFGYAVLNDLSVRDWVREPSVLGLDWVMLKGFDASAPMGPLITPAAAVPDPDDLAIRLWVNDELRQDARTSQMVFDVPSLIAHLSRVMTLEPGDLIATGTPSGVGMGRRPPAWLSPGDVVRAEVEHLGTLTTTIGPPIGAAVTT